MFKICVLIALLQLYYEANCQQLCILCELQYPRFLQHFEKIKHNSKFATSNVYNCFCIDTLNSSIIIKHILLIFFAMMIHVGDQSML